ncbi:hypothetical protein BJV74DRAFT_862265 [Russula compacta]|nr:hypothetical protein BJV74DRAFT_862265 [Russula compacta]
MVCPTGQNRHTRKHAHQMRYIPPLIAENPSYSNPLHHPNALLGQGSCCLLYPPGAISSPSISFEDPDGTKAQALLRHRILYAFGHVITVKRWKQPPPKRVPSTPAL